MSRTRTRSTAWRAPGGLLVQGVLTERHGVVGWSLSISGKGWGVSWGLYKEGGGDDAHEDGLQERKPQHVGQRGVQVRHCVGHWGWRSVWLIGVREVCGSLGLEKCVGHWGWGSSCVFLGWF